MQFETFSDFIQMGGHGAFVFSVYLISVLVLIGNVVHPMLKKRRFYFDQAARQERERS